MLLSTVQFLVRLSRETQDNIFLALCDEWSETMDHYFNGRLSMAEWQDRVTSISDAMEVISEIQQA